MKVGISAIRTNKTRLNRHELITNIQRLGHDVVYIGQPSKGEPHRDYNTYNVSFLPIPIARININPLKEIHTIYKTMSIFKKEEIEALIVYGIRTFPTIVTAAKLAGVKRIVCIVNGSGRLFEIKGFKGIVVRFMSYPMLMISFLQANEVLFQNKDNLELIKKKRLLLKNNYSVVNGSGVNLTEFEYSELEDRPVFTMISRLTASKGVNEFIKAAIIIKKTYQNSEFNLIGPLENDCEINQTNLEYAKSNGFINLVGSVEDVRPYIKKSRIFVLPPYYPEGVPRSILEAMSMGRPIITTNLPGCKETVINNLNGFLIEPRNEDALVEKMIWMIKNKNETEKMGCESRKLAIDKFDVNEVNRKILNKLNI